MIRVRDLHPVSHLNFGPIGPLIHQSSQIQVTIDSFVGELLLVDTVLRVLERKVQPMQCVQHFDIFLKKRRIDDTLDDVVRHDVLQLHDKLVHNFLGHDGEELHDDRVLRQFGVFAALLRDGLAQGIVHGAQDAGTGFLAAVSRDLLVKDEDDEPPDAHQLLVGVVVAIVELGYDDFNSGLYLLPEGFFVATGLSKALEEKLDGRLVEVKWLIFGDHLLTLFKHLRSKLLEVIDAHLDAIIFFILGVTVVPRKGTHLIDLHRLAQSGGQGAHPVAADLR